MSLRIFSLPATRLPLRTTSSIRAAARFSRFNSTSSSSASASATATKATQNAARVIEMARTAEKPSPFEMSLPVMWAVTGVMGLVAWGRMEEKSGAVEKLLIV